MSLITNLLGKKKKNHNMLFYENNYVKISFSAENITHISHNNNTAISSVCMHFSSLVNYQKLGRFSILFFFFFFWLLIWLITIHKVFVYSFVGPPPLNFLSIIFFFFFFFFFFFVQINHWRIWDNSFHPGSKLSWNSGPEFRHWI